MGRAVIALPIAIYPGVATMVFQYNTDSTFGLRRSDTHAAEPARDARSGRPYGHCYTCGGRVIDTGRGYIHASPLVYAASKIGVIRDK